MHGFIPGHALHEKGLQRQKGGGPLVGSQEQRALLVPLLNRLSTARCAPEFGLLGISPVRASGGTFIRRFFDALGCMRDACLLGDLFRRRPVLPGPGPPLRHGMSEFLDSTINVPGYTSHEKGLQRQHRRRYSGQQQGTKGAPRPAYKPWVNHG